MLSCISNGNDIHSINILDLPIDVLNSLNMYLGKSRYMFLYVVFSCKNSHEFNNLCKIKDNNSVSLVNIIHNSITYVRMFKDMLWGGDKIPGNKVFSDCLIKPFSDKIKYRKSEIIENRFDIINEIAEYLFASPNKFERSIIWNGEKVGTKIRYSKYFMQNCFWNEELSSIKDYNICGCIPFCWRCRRECDLYNIKMEDKLVVKSLENKRHYVCMIKKVILKDKHYKSVRDIYLEYSRDVEDWKNVWTDSISPKINVFVELLPLPNEPVPKKRFQFVGNKDKFYYMSSCYSKMVSWGQYNKNHNTDPHRIQIENVYNIPIGWVHNAKKNAKTALALI